MNEEKIKEVFADEEFVKKFFGKETPEEAQDLLAEKDIDVSIEELVAICSTCCFRFVVYRRRPCC